MKDGRWNRVREEKAHVTSNKNFAENQKKQDEIRIPLKLYDTAGWIRSPPRHHVYYNDTSRSWVSKRSEALTRGRFNSSYRLILFRLLGDQLSAEFTNYVCVKSKTRKSSVFFCHSFNWYLLCPLVQPVFLAVSDIFSSNDDSQAAHVGSQIRRRAVTIYRLSRNLLHGSPFHRCVVIILMHVGPFSAILYHVLCPKLTVTRAADVIASPERRC